VVFVTGHAQPGGREPDWGALARSGLTLVVYMGLQRAANVAVALMGGGSSPQTPVLRVRAATRPDESRELTTLAGLAEPASSGAGDAAGRTGAPGLLVIGDVVAGWAQTQSQAQSGIALVDGPTAVHQEGEQAWTLDAA
jgi:uroporphyrin-III C-methyltransferase